ncbi:MAG: hypothetical protein Q9191_007215 [Dirinaria sp. TL-2023a]
MYLSLSRRTRNRYVRALYIVLAIIALIDLLTLSSNRRAATKAPATSVIPSLASENFFLASIHWNNAAILSSNWTTSLLSLTEHLGPKNVYISILESGSWDESKAVLRELDAKLDKLGVRKTITLSESTHKDEMEQPMGPGWIETPRGRRELRRIPYLSKLRNKAMEPLEQERTKKEGKREYSRVIWLNDVVFTPADVIELLNTREGDYAAACSLDFAHPPSYYDTFAMRDIDGWEAASNTFPFFRSRKSRDALVRGDAVPVQSCWNGIAVFDADPFTGIDALSFRGIDDSLASYHVEGSECCLVHADNPLTASKGVWINPNVRVGYSPQAYESVHSSVPWPGVGGAWLGLWRNRAGRFFSSEKWRRNTVDAKLKQWGAAQQSRFEPGRYCLINEMQVLVENGWAHV